MSDRTSVALNAEEANQLADKAIMRHLTITIGDGGYRSSDWVCG